MIAQRKQSVREWHNELRIGQMAAALVARRVDLTSAGAVRAALQAESFSADCIARLTDAAVDEAAIRLTAV
ncbi:hypothetical protein SAMN05892877_103397 [Rhizobium subbaraonis]|uniref:Uncharacterized protein n=1 Tax=Rhizobium subbaraonis TaxID=908946 RepID=A0A285U5R2_9HYPH|nr:hypothetical protein [Rhizobium subbaraonis]SOC37053.1 hypothetical protein SAMN05892877_103397 [Rhizobium subbaraonis]